MGEESIDLVDMIVENLSPIDIPSIAKLVMSAKPTLHHNKLRTTIPKSFFI